MTYVRSMMPDLSAVRADMAAKEADPTWCWRCARERENALKWGKGSGGLCAQCAEKDRSILPQLAQNRIWEMQGKQSVIVTTEKGEVMALSPEVVRVLRRKARREARRAARLAELLEVRAELQTIAREQMAAARAQIDRERVSEAKA